MRAVAGIDFGTLSVRVTLFDETGCRLGHAVADYPLHRRDNDPDFATQSHDDHMAALTQAMQTATNVSARLAMRHNGFSAQMAARRVLRQAWLMAR